MYRSLGPFKQSALVGGGLLFTQKSETQVWAGLFQEALGEQEAVPRHPLASGSSLATVNVPWLADSL